MCAILASILEQCSLLLPLLWGAGPMALMLWLDGMMMMMMMLLFSHGNVTLMLSGFWQVLSHVTCGFKMGSTSSALSTLTRPYNCNCNRCTVNPC
jgi:hypothetical protein